MRFGTWEQWLAQPPEHQALYLRADRYQKMMDAYVKGEHDRKEYAKELAERSGRGRR
jgi:ferric-dicitrate binding protein FerR (iron transport regulator)